MRYPLPLVFFALAMAAALWRAPAPEAPVFTPASTTQNALPSFFRETLPGPQGHVGASSLARLPNNRLVVVWLENRTDDPGNATLRLLTQDRQGQWQKAAEIANRATVAASNFAYLSYLDSPLLHAEGNWLHLYFVSHGLFDGRSATLIHSFSSDAGHSWSAQHKTAIAPALNNAHLRPLPAHTLSQGELALPIEEGQPPQMTWLRLSATGKPLGKIRLAPGQSLLATGVTAPKLPAGAAALLALDDKHLLAAGNPDGRRQQLQLWESQDGGQNWQPRRLLESADDGAAEFTHPFLLLAADGQIHLTYTWRRQAIRHLRFTMAGLGGEEKP